MNVERWIETRREGWIALEQLVSRVRTMRKSRLDPQEVRRMISLYRRASADLARLRTAEASRDAIDELNRIVLLAHALIYHAAPPTRQSGIVQFLARDYPRTVRESWPFHLASFLIATLFAVLAFAQVQQDPFLIAAVMGGAEHEFVGQRTGADIRDRFLEADQPTLFSYVTTNNIRVALVAFALGITFGIGTVFILAVNGTMLGGFAGAYAQSGVGAEFWITVMPHGALELSAVVFAGGAGLMIGYSLWCPGRHTRLESLKRGGKKALIIICGLIPAFILAGLIEGFITPSAHLSDPIKLAIGGLAALVFWTHLLLGGRDQTDRTDPATDEDATNASAV
ncbi:MAG: stage II sporulation protein M [Phycisphaeraceae bacterium]|nr:stage II sporulation protein M [Phycisphaeraceae bacterium]